MRLLPRTNRQFSGSPRYAYWPRQRLSDKRLSAYGITAGGQLSRCAVPIFLSSLLHIGACEAAHETALDSRGSERYITFASAQVAKLADAHV
jgi:hypothetical protein